MEQECPYCGHKEQWQGDPMEEDTVCETSCRECEKEFEVVCHVSVWLDSRKIEGGE